MIVYGDPSFEQTPAALSDSLRARLDALIGRGRHARDGGTSRVPLDALRSLLIQAGQLEQAVHDAIAERRGLCYEPVHLEGEHAACHLEGEHAACAHRRDTGATPGGPAPCPPPPAGRRRHTEEEGHPDRFPSPVPAPQFREVSAENGRHDGRPLQGRGSLQRETAQEHQAQTSAFFAHQERTSADNASRAAHAPVLLSCVEEITTHAARAFVAGLTHPEDHPRVRARIAASLQAMREAIRSIPALPAAPLTVKVPEGFAFYALYPEQYVAAACRWLADARASAASGLRGSHGRNENDRRGGRPLRAAQNPWTGNGPSPDSRPGSDPCLSPDPRPDSDSRPTLVIGIRSIGTTLSAVVCATLELNGRPARRMSVRPAGHPFSRELHLESPHLRDAAGILIVDEGPGLSGSSMVAVAAALERLGVPRDAICFLPGHNRGPGPAASEEVRAWWAATRCYVTPLSELRWQGRSLEQRLAETTMGLLPGPTPVVRIEDLSAGQWRGARYADPAEWPAACVSFEATKYLFTLVDGRSVLWKFAGLAGGPDDMVTTEAAFARLRRRAEAGWTAAPLGTSHGFIALPWSEGRPLTRMDADPETLAHIGRYIAAVAGPPLSEREQDAAFARIGEMLYWNAREALGEAAAAHPPLVLPLLREDKPGRMPTPRCGTGVSPVRAGKMPGSRNAIPRARYGDGRLAPHEWLRTPDGRLLKTNAAGHDLDHTVVGPQPLAWDLAGALVEWGLHDHAAGILLEAARNAGVELPSPEWLAFYRAAYAAFRLGQCTMCAQATQDPAERQRLMDAVRFYQSELMPLLV